MPKIDDILKKMDVDKVKRNLEKLKEIEKKHLKPEIKKSGFKKIPYRPWNYGQFMTEKKGNPEGIELGDYIPIIQPLKMGNKILLQKAILVKDFNDQELTSIVRDMKDTMDHYKGVGIAAPQIGVSKRIIMYGFEKNLRYPNEKPVPFTILCNPEFQPDNNEKEEGWEGCLSVPGLRCLVSRFKNITYTGYDFAKQEIISVNASGFYARIIQHEIEHLDGILFPFRTDNIKSLSYESEMK